MKRIWVVWTVVVAMAFAPGALAVTLEEARETALAHAELTGEAVSFTEQQAEREDGRMVYDVEFFWDGAEYDYEIDAATGEILSFDNELGEGATGEAVTAERAMAIALAQAGLSADQVRVLKAELDDEDGRQVYEIEFIHDGMEYECEVDAATGRITGWDVDRD